MSDSYSFILSFYCNLHVTGVYKKEDFEKEHVVEEATVEVKEKWVEKEEVGVVFHL